MTSPVVVQRPITSTLVLVGALAAISSYSAIAQETTAPPAAAQPAPALTTPAGSSQAEVTANDVYVRSGDSTNHYTVCKLNAGNRVTILSERGEWYEILPPPGTFSLISGDFVDSADGRTGIVNGDNVRVRAGSLLNENKYTVQVSLQKGATVNILGRNPDGFLKIDPPAGATLWINKSYVRTADGTAPSSPPVATTEAPKVTTTIVPQTVPAAGAMMGSPATAEKSTTIRTTPPLPTTSKWRNVLDEADKAAREESAKETAQRDFSEIIARYKEVASQTEDEYARQYAASRIEEVGTLSDLAAAVQKVKQLDETAESKRREFMEGRAVLPAPTEPVPRGAQVQGELRISALYPPGSAVVRYRLVDPLAEKDRTIAYVEIPAESSIKIEGYIGKYVGVIAYEKRLHKASVDPVPIYIANELMLLEPPTSRAAQN